MLHDGTGQIALGSGDVGFFPAKLFYSMQTGREKLLVVHFYSDALRDDRIRKFSPKNPAYFERLFTDLNRAWTKKHVGYEYECKALFYKILFAVEREWEQNEPTVSDAIRDAVEYIHDRFTDRSLTVEELAARCHVSDTYFRKRFRETCGTTPLNYIHQLRMTHAKELLQSNYYTVEEVSERCGFNNIQYFSLFIKKQTGLSPSAYRKRLIEGKE